MPYQIGAMGPCAPGQHCQREKQTSFVARSSTLKRQKSSHFFFLNVGSTEKEKGKAKQNRSVGQIWLQGCHLAVPGLSWIIIANVYQVPVCMEGTELSTLAH